MLANNAGHDEMPHYAAFYSPALKKGGGGGGYIGFGLSVIPFIHLSVRSSQLLAHLSPVTM